MKILLFISYFIEISTYSYIVALRHDKSLVDKFEKKVREISDPFSNDYGNYLSLNELRTFILDRSLYQKRSRINDWLFQTGFTVVKDNLDTFYVESPNMSLDIPASLRSDIHFIATAKEKLLPFSPKLKIRLGSIDDGYVGKEVIQRIYDIENYDVLNSSGCVIEFKKYSSGFSASDLLFYEADNLNVLTNVSHIIGNINITDRESQLDVQMIANANNPKLWYWSFDGWVLEMASTLANTKDLPEVISISYDWAEIHQCDLIQCLDNMTSEMYVDRTNFELLKLALRGITVIVSSGDAGSPGRTAENCESINPTFPGSSPWVTSVGGVSVLASNLTYNYTTPLCLYNRCANGSKLLPVMFDTLGWTTGGGFGIYSSETVPWYQKTFTREYLSTTPLPPVGSFNPTGRGYPDVAIIGHNCAMYDNGYLQPVDGTSCSSPMFASMVMVLNRYQKSKRRPLLGFANPLLYTLASLNSKTFVDIKEGNNWATELMSCNNSLGFVASKGWDPVSGLGSPNIKQIMRMLDFLKEGLP